MTRFRFVEAEAAQFPVSLLCRVVGVTRQGFYAWKRRPPSARELADRELAERIKQIYAETEEIYGAPRIYSELKLGDGIRVGKKRVARLMRQLGIRGADGKRGGPAHDGPRPEAPLGTGPRRPRLRPGGAEPALGLRPQVHPDRAGLPLPRRRPGRLQPPDHRLVDARRPQGRAGARRARDGRHRSRRRRRRRRRAFRSRLAIHELGLRRLRQAVRDRPLDGLDRRPLGQRRSPRASSPHSRKNSSAANASTTREQARLRVFWYIECFYNPRRRHSSLGMLSPIDYEQRHQQEAIAA